MTTFLVQDSTAILNLHRVTDMEEPPIDRDVSATVGVLMLDFNSEGTSAFAYVDVNRLAVDQAILRVKELGDIRPQDDETTVRLKLGALFALSDALLDAGMEEWTNDRVALEIARVRGTA